MRQQSVEIQTKKSNKQQQTIMSSPNSIPKPQKMISFLENLHRKYSVLDKLAQKQYQSFQSQVVMLLVDENQNVDLRTYKEVIDTIGLDAFVLDILAKSINRNAISNQHQIKKNMNEMASELEDKAKELQKKIKAVERKESEINSKQANLKNRIKEFALQQEKDILNRLANKESQIKKNVNAFHNSLKLKEKILSEKKQEISDKLVQICEKQRLIYIRVQQLTKKSAVVQNNLASNNVDRSELIVKNPNSNTCSKQIKQISKKYEQCKTQLEKLKKKYKTTEMAYSKLKADLMTNDKDREKLVTQVSQLQTQRDKLKLSVKQLQQHQESNSKRSQVMNNLVRQKFVDQKETELRDMLEMLQISQIGPEDPTQQININKQIPQRNIKNKVNLRQSVNQSKGSSKIRQFIEQKRNKSKQQCNNIQLSNQCIISQNKCSIKHIPPYAMEQLSSNEMPQQMECPEYKFVKPASSQLAQSFIIDNNLKEDICIPKFLQEEDSDILCSRSPTQLLESIRALCSSESSQSYVSCLSLLQSGLLLQFAGLSSFQLTSSVLSEFLDLLLLLIQQSNPKYYEVIQYLAHQQFIQFLQHAYLNHESQLEITESATLLLSRIMMSTTIDLSFRKQFIDAIKLRVKISRNDEEDAEQFLKANINCLLSMIHT